MLSLASVPVQELPAQHPSSQKESPDSRTVFPPSFLNSGHLFPNFPELASTSSHMERVDSCSGEGGGGQIFRFSVRIVVLTEVAINTNCSVLKADGREVRICDRHHLLLIDDGSNPRYLVARI